MRKHKVQDTHTGFWLSVLSYCCSPFVDPVTQRLVKLDYSYLVVNRDLGKVLVIVPTYNERESLPVIVSSIRQTEPNVHILIADDNSPDGTGEVADGLSSSDNFVHVLHRSAKAGLGAAYLDAFNWAKANGYDVVVEMDADGSHRPQDLTKILDALTNNDVVLGSRWIKDGRVVNWAKSREILSRGGNLYTRMWLEFQFMTLLEVSGLIA